MAAHTNKTIYKISLQRSKAGSPVQGDCGRHLAAAEVALKEQAPDITIGAQHPQTPASGAQHGDGLQTQHQALLQLLILPNINLITTLKMQYSYVYKSNNVSASRRWHFIVLHWLQTSIAAAHFKSRWQPCLEGLYLIDIAANLQ